MIEQIATHMAFIAMLASFALLFKMNIDAKKCEAMRIECETMLENVFRHAHENGDYSTISIKRIAEIELNREHIRKSIDEMKEQLKNKKNWHKYVPFTIVISRRK